MPEWPTVIELPTDKAHVTKLYRKLEEYTQRLSNWTGEPLSKRFGAICKAALLREVLARGRVVVAEVEQRLRDEHGDGFEWSRFVNASEVVNDYCLTGGENVFGRDFQKKNLQ